MKIVAIILFSLFHLGVAAQGSGCEVHHPFKPSVVTFGSNNTIIGAGINGTSIYVYPDFMNSDEFNRFLVRGENCKIRVCYLIDGISIDPDLMYNDLDLMNLPKYCRVLSTSPLNSIFYRNDLNVLPYNTINEIASVNPYVRLAQRGERLNIRNGGEEGTLYIVDGVAIMR